MRFIGTVLLAFAALWTAFMLIMLIERPEDYATTALGAGIFALLFGIPGFFLLRRAHRKKSQKHKDERILGFINTRERFRIKRLSLYMGQSLAQTRKELMSLHQRGLVDLVFDEETGYYQKRKNWKRNSKTRTCESCGGKTHTQKALVGNWTCSYCGTKNQI